MDELLSEESTAIWGYVMKKHDTFCVVVLPLLYQKHIFLAGKVF